MPWLKQLTKLVDRLISLSTNLGAVILVAAVLVILVDVIGRMFNAPLEGAFDLTQMALVFIVFGGMALTDKQGGHISVDIFEHSFSRRLNFWLDIVGWLVGSAIFFGIAWTVIESAAISKLLNLSTNVLELPKAPFQYAVAAFSFLTAFSMLLRTVIAVFSPIEEHPHSHEEPL